MDEISKFCTSHIIHFKFCPYVFKNFFNVNINFCLNICNGYDDLEVAVRSPTLPRILKAD